MTAPLPPLLGSVMLSGLTLFQASSLAGTLYKNQLSADLLLSVGASTPPAHRLCGEVWKRLVSTPSPPQEASTNPGVGVESVGPPRLVMRSRRRWDTSSQPCSGWVCSGVLPGPTPASSAPVWTCWRWCAT